MHDLGMRELSRLIDVEDPAWPELKETLEASPVCAEVLPSDRDPGRASIHQLQDVVAFAVDAWEQVAGDEDLVFYGAPEHPDGPVRLTVDGPTEQAVTADLDRLPLEVRRVVVAAIDGAIEHLVVFNRTWIFDQQHRFCGG